MPSVNVLWNPSSPGGHVDHVVPLIKPTDVRKPASNRCAHEEHAAVRLENLQIFPLSSHYVPYAYDNISCNVLAKKICLLTCKNGNVFVTKKLMFFQG